MKEVSYVISTYTSDVSGVCSALYELGGMVVIHDPSGCNSTYNTHDEPRWFDQDSLIFISGLSQMDAIMGDDDKFIQDILRAARELQPKFIALVRSPIPLMIGTDFKGIAREITLESGIPCFFVPSTGMRSYVEGAGKALEMVVNVLMPEINSIEENEEAITEEKVRKVNILGATPLDFSVNGCYASLKTYLQQAGFILQGSLALETNYEEMCKLYKADVNLVVTAAGLPAARAMKEKYGIPYVAAFPCGKVKGLLEEAFRDAINQKIDCNLWQELPWSKCLEEEKPVLVIHEPLIATSIAWNIQIDYGRKALPLSLRPLASGLSQEEIKPLLVVESEEEMEKMFSQASMVVADPMYQPICPKDIPFYPLPHEAFSGRIYRKFIPDLLEIDFLKMQ